MRVAYFDCFAGASGDMMLGALVDGGWALDDLKATFAKIPLGGYEVRSEEVRKGLLRALQVHIDIDAHEHTVERNLHDIVQLLEGSSLDEDVVAASKRLFERLAEVEGRMHGVAPEAVHFHEVGAVDSILDVVGVVAGLRALGIERIVCSPVNIGGSAPIQTRHGWWPIPGPATLDLMKDKPIYAMADMGETLTPTGALLLSELADEFGPIPTMQVKRVGYGAGMRDSEIPNVLRLIIGEETAANTHGMANRYRNHNRRHESAVVRARFRAIIQGRCAGRDVGSRADEEGKARSRAQCADGGRRPHAPAGHYLSRDHDDWRTHAPGSSGSSWSGRWNTWAHRGAQCGSRSRTGTARKLIAVRSTKTACELRRRHTCR